MDITVILTIIFVLIILLVILLFLLFFKKEKPVKKVVTKQISFQALVAILENPQSSSIELKNALDKILKFYAKIDNLQNYLKIIMLITTHKNTNKNIIISFEKDLIKLNPNYKVEINQTLLQSLNKRN